MLKNIVSLSQKLISIKSTVDNPIGLDEVLEVVLNQLKDFTIERFEQNGVKSALVYVGKTRPKRFKILLNIHLDVIPAKESQFKPKIVGNKLYGIGSMDMKSNVVCAIFAFKEMAKVVDYPLGLQIVTDEEVGGVDGTKYQVAKGVRADFVLATEPTNFNIVYKAKGVLQVKISTKGKTFHGAYPWMGENAIEKMNKFLNIVGKKLQNPKSEKWLTTVNVSNIETTNQTFNKIPDDCAVSLDIRYIADDAKTILKKVKSILPKGFKLEIVGESQAVNTKKDDKNIIKLAKIVKSQTGINAVLRGANGTSDVSHFVNVNCSGIEFGPIGGGIGSDSEWVDIKSLETYYKILIEFLE